MNKFLNEKLDFCGHISTLGAENTVKRGPFKLENNAQKHPKQIQTNFEKVQIRLFRPPKWPQQGC